MNSSLLVSVAFLVAQSSCSPPTIEGTPVSGTSGFAPGPGPLGQTGPVADPDAHLPLPDGGFGEGGAADPSNMPDMDGDGVPDPYDCDPGSNKIGAVILDDDLATAKGAIAAAPGFDASAWIHAQGGYQQQTVRNAADASLFNIEAAPSLVASVTATPLRSGTFTPRLRQQFIILGASAAGGQFGALACGVEYVEGLPQGVASIVGLQGTATGVRTTPLKRETRPMLADGQDFGIEARLQGGTLMCTITQGQSTTTVAAQVGDVQGSLGFFTQQLAAEFKAVHVCALN